jgi:hypothetical protein
LPSREFLHQRQRRRLRHLRQNCQLRRLKLHGSRPQPPRLARSRLLSKSRLSLLLPHPPPLRPLGMVRLLQACRKLLVRRPGLRLLRVALLQNRQLRLNPQRPRHQDRS